MSLFVCTVYAVRLYRARVSSYDARESFPRVYYTFTIGDERHCCVKVAHAYQRTQLACRLLRIMFKCEMGVTFGTTRVPLGATEYTRRAKAAIYTSTACTWNS